MSESRVVFGRRRRLRLATALSLALPAAACTGSEVPTNRVQSAITATPWSDAASSPVLVGLTYGKIRGSLDYEVEFSLGSLPPVGLAPGLEVGVRLRSGGAASGVCGGGCELPMAKAWQDGAVWRVTEPSGLARRFVSDGGVLREAPVDAGAALRPATATVAAGALTITEPGGRLVRGFDALGRERTRTTPWGTLTLSYDGAGRFVGASNAAGRQLSAGYDGGGRLSQVTDATGFTMRLIYGYDGRVVSVEGPPDNGVTPSLQVGWSGASILSVARLGFGAETLTYQNGKVVGATDQNGSAYALRATSTTVEVSNESGDRTLLTVSNGKVTASASSNGAETTYTRDALGRVVQVSNATGGAPEITTFSYDAGNRLIAMTDPSGAQQQWSYDARGNLLTERDADGRTVSYSYDANDNLTAVTDPLGRVTSFSYDANGLRTQVSGGGVTTRTSYTPRGQIASETDAFGVTSSFSYDGEGRMTGATRPGQPAMSIARTAVGGGEQVTTTVGGRSTTVTTDVYRRVLSQSSSTGAQSTTTYDPFTGLPAQTQASFRGAVTTRQQSYTNTGDVNTVTVNGRQRQLQARVVPPGTAWFSDGMPGDGSGSGSGSGAMPVPPPTMPGDGSGSGSGSGAMPPPTMPGEGSGSGSGSGMP